MTTATAIRTVALAGNPNSGKTTLFNALTGLRQKVANYPGVTVEKRIGRCTLDDGVGIDVIDLPGTYSLLARSPDEQVAVDVLTGRIAGTAKPDAIVVVVDASNLQRNLYLVSQLMEMGFPLVVALNMMDIAERRGQRVDADELARQLGVPVVPLVGHKGRGIEKLKRAIAEARIPPEPDWPLDEPMKHAVHDLAGSVREAAAAMHLSPRALAERLLCGEASEVPLEPAVAAKVRELRQVLENRGIDPVQGDVESHYRWIEQVAAAAASPVVAVKVRGSDFAHAGNASAGGADPAAPTLDVGTTPTFTDRADRILLHRVWGLVVFTLVMGGLFVSIFTLADPVMGWAESLVGSLGELVAARLPEGTLKDLWTDGIVAGVGGVVVFVPQIAILFLFLAILEDSGYLARAAFLMDRVLGKVGLNGKSFIPLLSSFACAIPGIMAARTIESRRERLATIFVAPFMGCSARIPVYVLLIGTFFAAYSGLVQGLIMLGCYVLGVLAAVATAWAWKFWTTRAAASSFILELPTYKLPQPGAVARVVVRNTWAFVRRAGTIIFCLSVILWALTYWPRLPEQRVAELTAATKQAALADPAVASGGDATGEPLAAGVEQAVAAEQLRQSYAGRLGHFIEPVIRPLGFDWKIGVGLVGSFAAREVFVSTMGIVYSVGEAEDDTQPLAEAMRADTYADGSAIWSPLVAATLLIWFVLAMQCMSTLAIVRRETGTWRWPLLQLVYMNALAYVLCLVVYQVGRMVT
jgi:ferrous iron transport protein B